MEQGGSAGEPWNGSGKIPQLRRAEGCELTALTCQAAPQGSSSVLQNACYGALRAPLPSSLRLLVPEQRPRSAHGETDAKPLPIPPAAGPRRAGVPGHPAGAALGSPARTSPKKSAFDSVESGGNY